MVQITTTIGIPPDMYNKCIELGINRSKFCREALSKEIARIEEMNKCQGTRPSNHPDSTPIGEAV
jgi:hypothetical protein